MISILYVASGNCLQLSAKRISSFCWSNR